MVSLSSNLICVCPTGAAGPATLRDGEDCVQIMVPDRTVGLIIGRGGETIRDLQERSGCHINIVGESKSVNGLRPVNLIGPHHAAAQAKELILEIVDSDTRNGSNPDGNKPARPPKNDNYNRDSAQDLQYMGRIWFRVHGVSESTATQRPSAKCTN